MNDRAAKTKEKEMLEYTQTNALTRWRCLIEKTLRLTTEGRKYQ